jgi:hypothetical protein
MAITATAIVLGSVRGIHNRSGGGRAHSPQHATQPRKGPASVTPLIWFSGPVGKDDDHPSQDDHGASSPTLKPNDERRAVARTTVRGPSLAQTGLVSTLRSRRQRLAGRVPCEARTAQEDGEDIRGLPIDYATFVGGNLDEARLGGTARRQQVDRLAPACCLPSMQCT